MTLKEIVKPDTKLLEKAQNLLKEEDYKIFKEKYNSVVKEILDYRNEKIDEYILDLINDKTDLNRYIVINGPIEIYTVNDDSELDDLGMVIQKLMKKYINFGHQ